MLKRGEGRGLPDFQRGKFSPLIFECIYYSDTNHSRTSQLLTVDFPNSSILVFRKHALSTNCKAPNKRMTFNSGWTPENKIQLSPRVPKWRSFRFPFTSTKVAGLPCRDPRSCLFSLYASSFMKELLNERPSVTPGKIGLLLTSHNPPS